MEAVQNMCEDFRENWKKTNEHYERLNKQLTNDIREQCEDLREDLRESLRAVHENLSESLRAVHESMETEPAEDVEGTIQTSDNHQIEVSTSVPEEVHAKEIQEMGVTLETRAKEISERRGEREAPNKPIVDEKVAERTNSKPRKSRVKSLAAAGTCRKKRKKKKWRVLQEKTMHGKSSKKVFQRWIDHVRKKHREQMNKQQQMQWDPGGLVYKPRNTSSTVPDHRSQDNTFATRILARG
jgi:gas vesicle protein